MLFCLDANGSMWNLSKMSRRIVFDQKKWFLFGFGIFLLWNGFACFWSYNGGANKYDSDSLTTKWLHISLIYGIILSAQTWKLGLSDHRHYIYKLWSNFGVCGSTVEAYFISWCEIPDQLIVIFQIYAQFRGFPLLTEKNSMTVTNNERFQANITSTNEILIANA